MSEEAALLAAIAEAPDDDAPRLVYADWLQAHGDPRGEFIQLQCQLAAAPDDERRRAIKIAENKLLAAHGEAWLGPVRAVLPRPDLIGGDKLEFVRGFLDSAQLTSDCTPRFAALWECAPLLRRLRLSRRLGVEMPIKKPILDGLFDAPQLSRLRELELQFGGAGNAGAAAVANAPQLAGLRSLTMSLSVWGESIGIFERGATDLVLDDAGAAALARSPHLAQLETLRLDSNRLTSQGVSELAHGRWRLRTLELGNNLLEPTTLARSLAGPAFAHLEVLGISGTAFDPKSIAELVRSPALAHLRELDLEKCHLGVEGIEALCKALALPALRSLRLERNSLCDKGGLAMAACETFAQLTNLEAGHNRMGHKAAVALASSAHLANLDRLTLNEPRWKPETTALFAVSPTLAKAKIYLQGRLVGRKASKGAKASPGETTAESVAKPRSMKGKATPRGKAKPSDPASKTAPKP